MEKTSLTEVESAIVADKDDNDTLQTAQVWLNVFASSITHSRKGADVSGQTNAGSNSACDWSRKGARETIHEVDIQKQADV